MADHVLENPSWSKGPKRVTARCRFTTAGTGAVTGTFYQGVVSVTRTGVGVFEVLFPTGWVDLHLDGVALGGAAAAQLGRVVLTSSTLSTRKAVVTVVDFGGTPAAVETTGVTVSLTFSLQRNS